MRWWWRLLHLARARRAAAEAVEAHEARVQEQGAMMVEAARDLAALPPAVRAARVEAALRVRAPQHPLVAYIERRLAGEDDE